MCYCARVIRELPVHVRRSLEMVASVDTITDVIRVVRHHVNDDTFRAIINGLSNVSGNKSFRETIQRLKEQVSVDPPA